ncbi:MAG: glycosyl hydrolase [Paludibacter sp.]|nr:glycosyl hydrolase [Paludibacter sp.]
MSELSGQTRSAKRGVSFNFTNDADLQALAFGTSWFYNWGVTPNNVTNTYNSVYGYEFCPMAWNGEWNSNAIRAYAQAHPDCKYILAFNEPNFTSQANLTPAQAAAKWSALKALAQELNLQIISPACNYSAWTQYSAPYKWLDEFFAQPGVSINDVAGIAIHSYMGWAVATNGYVQEYINRYNKPLWLTEFCAWDNFQSNNGGTALQQRKEMIDMLDFMERNPMVARYAWFIPRRDEIQNPSYPYMELLTNTNGTERGILTETGQIWTYMSSYDNNFYHNIDAIIEAEHYIFKSKGVYMEQTSDTAGILDVYDYASGDTLTYNVNIPTAGDYTFRLHILSNSAATLSVKSSSGTATESVPSTSNLWADYEFTVSLNAGNQQILFKLTQGSFKWNYFVITNHGATPPPTPNPLGTVVLPPPVGDNLALNKPINSPSASTDLQPARLAVDGNTGTRWESKQGAGQDNKMLTIDLLAIYSITDIIINWEGAYASVYNVEISTDSVIWTQILSTTTGSAGEKRITLENTPQGRYVRINCVTRGTQWGFSIWEIEVYGSVPSETADLEQNAVFIYPNPVENILRIQTEDDISQIILMDISGTKLLEMQNVKSVNMSNFSAGIYILTVKFSDGKFVVRKIMKQ